MKQRITILLVNEHPALSTPIRSMLTGFSHLSLVAEAHDEQMVLELCNRHQPDVVLVDLDMFSMDPVMITRLLLRLHPRCAVLSLTDDPDDDRIIDMFSRGGKGSVLKTAPLEDIACTIAGVADGAAIFMLSIDKLLQRLKEAVARKN